MNTRKLLAGCTAVGLLAAALSGCSVISDFFGGVQLPDFLQPEQSEEIQIFEYPALQEHLLAPGEDSRYTYEFPRRDDGGSDLHGGTIQIDVISAAVYTNLLDGGIIAEEFAYNQESLIEYGYLSESGILSDGYVFLRMEIGLENIDYISLPYDSDRDDFHTDHCFWITFFQLYADTHSENGMQELPSENIFFLNPDNDYTRSSYQVFDFPVGSTRTIQFGIILNTSYWKLADDFSNLYGGINIYPINADDDEGIIGAYFPLNICPEDIHLERS